MITEEEFKIFCKDFVEKYEGCNFAAIVSQLNINGRAINAKIEDNYKFTRKTPSMLVLDYGTGGRLVLYLHQGYLRINGIDGNGDIKFYHIEDAYTFFKIDHENTKECKTIIVNVSMKELKKVYIEKFAREHGFVCDEISLNIEK